MIHNKHSHRSTQSLTTTDIKTNMRHMHTSIVYRYLAAGGNNKILRTPPPHISISEEILPRLIRHTLAQIRTYRSPCLKSYLHKVDAKSHPSPLCPFCNTHIQYTHHLFHCTHICTTLSPLDLWRYPAAGQLDEENDGKIGLPPTPLARVMVETYSCMGLVMVWYVASIENEMFLCVHVCISCRYD